MVTPSSLEALQRENEELRAELVDLHGAADQTATRVMILTQERDEARAALREAGEMVHLLSHPLEGPFHRCRATFCRRALGEPDGRVDVERVDVLARP